MDAERALRHAIAFARSTATPDGRLCTACMEILGVEGGVGITLMGGDGAGLVCVSDEQVRALEELQFTTGVGPCREAFDTRIPVVAGRMDDVSFGRWPMFTDLAVACGIGAVFAYPLSSHGAIAGVLTIYQKHAGNPTDALHDDGMFLSEILAATLLSLQEGSPDGELGAALDDAVAYRAQVHQASGMLAVQLSVPASEALIRMRAYAFAHDIALDVVAADIVGRRLRLTDDRPPERP